MESFLPVTGYRLQVLSYNLNLFFVIYAKILLRDSFFTADAFMQ